MAVLKDLFGSLEGLVSVAITSLLTVGALIKLRARSIRLDVRSNSPNVGGTGNNVVTGGATGTTVIGGSNNTISVVQAALRPGEGLTVGFWGMTGFIALFAAMLGIPFFAKIVLLVEIALCVALPILALKGLIDIQGKKKISVLIYLFFTVLVSWVVLRNYNELNFLPNYVAAFRHSFKIVFGFDAANSRSSKEDIRVVVALGMAAFGLTMLIASHVRLGLSYLGQDRGLDHAGEFGLVSLIIVFISTLIASGLVLVLWDSIKDNDEGMMSRFLWNIVSQTFSLT